MQIITKSSMTQCQQFILAILLPSIFLSLSAAAIDYSKENPPRKKYDMVDYLDSCNNLIWNGNAMQSGHPLIEDDPLYKWDAYGSGSIEIVDGAFIHSGRLAVHHGPSQVLDFTCFVEGLRYEFIADLKIQNKNGEALLCDKNIGWGSHVSCPIVVLKLDFENGGVQWINLQDTVDAPWKMNNFNIYKAPFEVTRGMATAKQITVMLAGPRDGVSIVFDKVGIYPKCKNMISGGNADTKIQKQWKKWGAKKVDIVSPGADGTKNAFLVTGRTREVHGVRERLQVECFREETQLVFSGKFKLIDETSGDLFQCNNYAKLWDKDACVSIGVFLVTAEGARRYHFFGNDAAIEEGTNGWLNFRSTFRMTTDIVNSQTANLHILGPRPGLDIMFDELTLVESFEPERDCNGEMISNGDMEGGDFANWETEGGGIIVVESGEPFYSNYAAKSIGRVKRRDGIKQELLMKCLLVVGKEMSVTASVIVMRDDKLFQCKRTKEMTDQDECPYFSLEIIKFGGEKKWMLLPDVGSHAVSDDNEYTYIIKSTFRNNDIFQWAKKVYLHISGPGTSVSILVDNVSMVPKDSSDACKQMVVNDKQVKKASFVIPGWNVYGEGDIVVRKFPRINDLVVDSRTHHTHGLRQVLDLSCFESGQRYKFEANLELFDETGKSFVCNRYVRWGHEFYCPLFSIQLIRTGSSNWIYMMNQSPDSWKPGYNQYEHIFKADDNLAGAEKAYLYVYGPRAGVNMAIKDINIRAYQPEGNDCIQFIRNGHAESGQLDHWRVFGIGLFDIISGGADAVGRTIGESKAFRIRGRSTASDGMQQELNLSCLQEGVRLQITAYMKLLSGGMPFICDKSVEYGDPLNCPLISFKFYIPSAENGILWQHIFNENPLDWKGDEFNEFRGQFVITSEMITSTEVYLYIHGPGREVDLIVDGVSLNKFLPPQTSCTQLIRNGDAENGMLDEWKAFGASSLQFYNQGPPGSTKAFQIVGRTASSDGPEQDINPDCLIEGKKFEVTAQVKLLEGEQMLPYVCNQTVHGKDPLMCPLISLRLNVMGMSLVENVLNDYAEFWKADDFNIFHAIFEVNPDMAVSEVATLFLRGPQKDVSIVFDDVKIQEYFEHNARSCNMLVKNGNAETPTLDGWVAGGSGFYEYIKDGSGGHYFQYSHRTVDSDGPRQYLSLNCLVEGMAYDFKAKVKLLDEDGYPFVCDSARQLRTDDYCVDVVIDMDFPTSKSRLRFLNENPGSWTATEFNDFYFKFIPTEEMLSADKLSFRIAGPHPSVTILFDDVSLIPSMQSQCGNIINGDAENGDFFGWDSFNKKGTMTLIPNGIGGSMAFKQSGRSHNRNGIIQDVDLSCIQPRTVYEIEFKFRLEDEQEKPLGCDKEANDIVSKCVDVAIRIASAEKSEWVVLSDRNKEVVIPGEFATYHTIFYVSADMVEADSTLFLLSGPTQEASMILDDIRLFRSTLY